MPTLTVTSDHKAVIDAKTIARAGEMGVVLTVNVDATIRALGIGKKSYIDFQQANGSAYYAGDYDCSSGTFNVTLGVVDTILTYSGKLWMQFVLRDAVPPTGVEVWKSIKVKVIVEESINATLPASYVAVPPMTAPTTFPSENVTLGDVGSRYTATEVETALQEIAGSGRTTETVKVNADNISYIRKDTAYLSELTELYPASIWTKALDYKTFVIDVNATKTGSYTLAVGQTIEFRNNAIITQNDNLSAFIIANGSGHICGTGIIQTSGSKPSSSTSGSFGIKIMETAFDWSIVGNFLIRYFKQAGVAIYGDDIVVAPTGESQIAGVRCYQNWNGFEFWAGFPAEYITISNCQANDNANVGVYLEAGNITWNGGIIKANSVGVHLKHPTSGINAQHGQFIGTQINHNVAMAVHADGVVYGHDFVGCHFYDNDDAALGLIRLDNCRGINIVNGVIGCSIEYLAGSGAGIGYNRVAGNFIAKDRAILTGTGDQNRKWLFVDGNYNVTGAWPYNDEHSAYALKYIAGSTPLTGETSYNLITSLGTEQFDNRLAMGAAYVVPFRGNYEARIRANLTCGTTPDTEYIWFGRDDTGSGTFIELYQCLLKDIIDPTGFRCNVDFDFDYPISAGGQFSIFLSGCDSGRTYTFAAGGEIVVISDK